MINIQDKKILESTFAEDFASPYFPILAELYLNDGDLSRARKVCEIGLNHDSANVDGKFIFAKVALAEEKLTVAEKWLKNIVTDNPSHFNALRMLIKLEFQLSRSPKTIQNYINQLLKFLPEDTEGIEWQNNIKNLESVTPPSNSVLVEVQPSNDVPIQAPKTNTKDIYKIGPSMATLTMARVLKSQRHYQEALAVIDVLESNDLDSDSVARQKEEILQLISESKK